MIKYSVKNLCIVILSLISGWFSAQKTPIEIAKLILSNRNQKEKYQKYLFENRDIELEYERDIIQIMD
ncbi:hypothetical protein B0A69_09515 [Chryseobacterium shigense]|nr:hypothetical protein B0A69_09515 [Chryseobacterium shigense]